LTVSKSITPLSLENLATRYFGTNNPIYDIFLKRTLIAAVARAYEPGCKHDTTLVLQGKQGAGKSSFFNVLGGDWFDDSMGVRLV
jgi:predicted P-loop ATPase